MTVVVNAILAGQLDSKNAYGNALRDDGMLSVHSITTESRGVSDADVQLPALSGLLLDSKKLYGSTPADQPSSVRHYQKPLCFQPVCICRKDHSLPSSPKSWIPGV